MLTALFYSRGLYIMNMNQTFTKEHYQQVLRNLCDAIQGRWPSRKTVNCTNSFLTTHLDLLGKTQSSDQAKSYLLIILSTLFAPENKVTMAELHDIQKDGFLKCLQQWKSWLTMCVETQGIYFEGVVGSNFFNQ